jgi:hypothetical protein
MSTGKARFSLAPGIDTGASDTDVMPHARPLGRPGGVA